jgi:protein-tyrosine kinase
MSKLKKALEKAKEARGDEYHTVIQEGESARPALRSQVEKGGAERHDVHVDYSKTKVINIDPRILKKNRVISFFQESASADQIKILRTQVLNRLKEIGGNSLLVTSANPGEGKTFTSINLGVSIAQELDRTVLLVDADLRHPSIHHYDFANDFFGVEISKGLSDYLLGQVEIPDVLLNPGVPKLSILPAGHSLPNSAEVLGSPRMELLVEEMKKRYSADRILIFDSPSVLTCTDAVVLSRFVDGILLVVEEEKTTPNDLRRAMELLNNKPVLGTVLNKSKYSKN